VPKQYLENEIRQQVQEALTQDIHFLYQKNFLNYQGKTKESHRPYIEVISEELLRNYEQMKRIGQNIAIRQTKSFQVGHNGVPNVDSRLRRYNTLRYSEKLLAIALYNSSKTYCFGKIFDYQVPLKETQQDKFGEIDLVAQKGQTIKLLELKIAGNTEETLLRALLEVYTYYKLLSSSIVKFITDYSFSQATEYYFQPGILTDKHSLSGTTISEHHNYPSFKNLVRQMNEEIGVPIEFFLYSYLSQRLQHRSQTKKNVDLVGEIQIAPIEI